MSASPLLQVTELHRHFGRLHVVRGVSFTLASGEAAGLLGVNGAGKTTTLRMLAGVLAADAGTVEIGGERLGAGAGGARRLIGYLPERPPLYPELSVAEYLGFCARLRGVRSGPAVDSACERCGLTDVRRRIIGTLSKGFQQRVGIAQAILHEPPLVILDEPTVGLDPVQSRQIRALVRELATDRGVILSSHQLPEIQASCDRVLMIAAGRLVLDASLRELEGNGSPSRTRLRLRSQPDDSALLAIDGVLAVQHGDDGHLLLQHRAGSDVVERIAEHAADSGWGLQELSGETGSLERHFMRLACGHETAGGDAS